MWDRADAAPRGAERAIATPPPSFLFSSFSFLLLACLSAERSVMTKKNVSESSYFFSPNGFDLGRVD